MHDFTDDVMGAMLTMDNTRYTAERRDRRALGALALIALAAVPVAVAATSAVILRRHGDEERGTRMGAQQ